MTTKPKTSKATGTDEESQELLRSKIYGEKLLKERDSIEKDLKDLDKAIQEAFKKIDKAKNTKQRPTAKADAMAVATKLQSLTETRRRLLVDRRNGIDSLLSKKLPDKRSTEVVGPGGKDLFGGLANALGEALKK